MLFCSSYRLVTHDDAAGLAITVGAAKLSRGIGLGGLRQRSCLFPRSCLGGGLRRGGRTGNIAAAAAGAAAGVATGVAAAAATLLGLVDGNSQAAKIFKEVEHECATLLRAAASATIGFAALRLAALRLAALGLGSTALGRLAAFRLAA